MTTRIWADAALTTAKEFIADPFGNPLSADDLPYEDRGWMGDDNDAVAIKDGDNPGVNNVVLPILHLVPEWSSGAAIGALDEIRSTAHNGYVYEAQGAGTTGGAEPVWPTTIGQTVVDNDITWECVRRTTEPEVMRLALTQLGLAAATPGASLDLGVTQIPGGAINAIEIWIEVDGVAALTNVTELYISLDHLVNEAA